MPIMSKDANIANSSWSIKDGSAAGGFLSKASNSIKRSPSKRHASRSSNPLPSLDQVFYETQKGPPSESLSSPQKRPDAYRTRTAPLENLTTTSSLNQGTGSHSAVEATMLVATFTNNHKREPPTVQGRSAGAVPQNGEYMHPASNAAAAPLPPPTPSMSGGQTPNVLYQHIHDMASKRISTLDYFRKAHEGRVFWFNTVHFSQLDLSRLPSFSSPKLSRRAINYLLLGLSIPPVLDVHPQNNSAASAAANATAAHDFLKTLNALLGEFETYQQNHPSDGSTASTLSRARIPHMFKRATQATTSRTRRASSNTGPEIGLPLQQAPSSHSSDPQHHHHHHHHHHHGSQSSTTPSLDNTTTHHPNSSSTNLSTITLPTHSSLPPGSTTLPTSSFSSFPAPNPTHSDLPNSTLSPSETPYTYLLTPPLPFPPNFHTVFATLCDVLIDTYQRILVLVNSPAVCQGGYAQGLGEVFAKADARLRKVIVGGIVREFEGAAREGARREVAGVGRVVLGGLMGN